MIKKRIASIDALRGFSLAGIVIVHMVENYIGGPAPAEAMVVANQGILDGIVNGFLFLFIRGKFFALFSFLFGLSFFIQMENGAHKGARFEGRFLWRLLLLLIIGAIHHLFYRGDILTIYALLGILLIPFFKMNTKLIIATIVLLFLGLGRYIVFTFFGSDSLFSGIDMDPSNPALQNYYNIIKNGTLDQVFLRNTTEGHLMKLDFQLGVFGRGYLTFGFFLLGLLAGRLQLFQKFREQRSKVLNAFFWSLALFLLSMVAMALLFMSLNQGSQGQQAQPDFNNWQAMFALSAYDLSNIFMTFMLIFAFLLIYLKVNGERFLVKFAPYGRMALTNYFLQTLIGTALLYGWGLGYLGELRSIYTFLIGIVIIIIQMYFSKWWLSNYKYGPLEWLWRSLTYFKVYPFKKISQESQFKKSTS
ncbi:MAG: DUF418 domain-containing protein [Flavobacteriaceae bacterium]|nr:DUF418 domain-containing protein [Flavobacteriaceae bacterium]